MKERTYRMPILQTIVLFLVALFFGYESYFSITYENWVLAVLLLLFGLSLFMYATYLTSLSITISEIEITSSRLWIPNTLVWTDIDQVSGSINGLKLKNRDGDVTVSLNSQVSGYEEVIAALGDKRPDLFSTPELSVLQRTPVPTILMIASLIFGAVVLVAVLSGFLVISGNGTPIIVGVLTFIGLFMVAVVLSAPQYISMEGNTLMIKYLLKETSYHADEIASVDLNYQRTRNGRIYFTKLTLKNKKNLTITGMKVGASVTYLVLKEWHKRQTDARFSV